MGLGPYFFSASICAAAPYPLLDAKPYSGMVLSYSTIIRSLVTFATMLAAAMDTLLASPFIIGTCGIVTWGMVTASLKESVAPDPAY